MLNLHAAAFSVNVAPCFPCENNKLIDYVFYMTNNAMFLHQEIPN